jgi:ATP-dependent Clp protease adaptor protein ClpS
MSAPVLDPVEVDDISYSGRWMVIMFNNPLNTFEEVIMILMVATECSMDEAELETWEAHLRGKAPVHFASKEECNRVSKIISSIGVVTEVQPEWK